MKVGLRLVALLCVVVAAIKRNWRKVKAAFTAERTTAGFTVVLALATLALVGVSIYQHFDTIDIIQAAKRIATSGEELVVADQRAWVSCPVVINDDLTYDANGARFVLGCAVNNTGHSPAREVFLKVNAFPNVAFDIDAEQRRVCAEAETHTQHIGEPHRIGFDVFPGEPLPGSQVAYISAATLNSVRRSSGAPGNAAFMEPFLVTCIGYKIVGDERYHHTPRIFRVLRNGNKAININDGTVPKSELSLIAVPIDDLGAD
jgi:hypothetical protein